ncbi:family 20 glycosylhydrolase [Streptomyces boninensis]|uniref:family 20 glycosylhydrolase n=1 Tax=Streptomyces boninensis TaxID=2039455 RepID=UPI003B21CA88
MRRLLIGVGAALALLSPAVFPAPAAAASAPPVTIPAVQEWFAGQGASYRFGQDTRVVLSAADAPVLGRTADRLAGDLASMTGVRVRTAVGSASPGDISLRTADPGHAGREAYRADIGSVLAIRAATDHGVFNGTRTVLQLIHQNPAIAAGTIVDWPAYPERGLMLDLGRKYLSTDFLRARIRELSYLKLNVLHLHLSDSGGFRLESGTHPEIVADQHYTKREIRDLITYAADYNVEIIPELDFPAHADPVVAAHPELKLAPGMLDLSKPATYDLLRDLFTEFLPLFPGRYFHVGADEYLQDTASQDALRRYINWADGLVQTAGKTTRVWNDGLRPGGTVTVNPDVVVEHWSQHGLGALPWTGPAYTAPQLAARGHRVLNAAYTPTYYTTDALGQLLTAPEAALYDGWDPSVFVDGSRVTQPGGNLGSKISLWFNDPSWSEPRAERALDHRLRTMSQQTWGSPKPAPTYLFYLPVIRKVGEAPPA